MSALTSYQKSKWFIIALCWFIVIVIFIYHYSFSARKIAKQEIPPALTRLENANPVADMHKAVDNGDFKFMVLGGYVSCIPGLPSEAMRLKEITGTHSIVGTGDFFESTEHVRLQTIAKRYAEQYNSALYQWLIKHPNIVKQEHLRNMKIPSKEDK
ncbi:MAG: hypothetical protein WC421_11465 [Elusimicrobiales bacterium]